MNKNIVAIGGGGFGRQSLKLNIENYILSLSGSKKPRVGFIPTASGDSDSYKVNFYRAFSSLNCHPSHLDFFKRTINLEHYIDQQDIIFVGGGNTKSMLGVWKEWGLHNLLRKAYNNGVVMSGVSAGAICWFDSGITDSLENDLSLLSCLSFVPGICCPHFDEEPQRTPFVLNSLTSNLISNCICIDGGCGLHLVDGTPYKSVRFVKDKNAYSITFDNNEIKSIPFPSIDIY